MTIYAYGDRVPVIHESAFVHPDAVIIGSVTIGAESTIWPGAVLRGDDGEIIIGARTSIQDNTVIHTMPNQPTVVGDDCVIGHIVHLESCTIANSAQVSSGAIVLHRAVVGTGAIVAARISRVVFGAWDEKVGASGSLYDLLRDGRLGNPIEVIAGVKEAEAAQQLRDFFASRRT